MIYGSDIGEDLQTLLEGDDLAVVLNSKHQPRCIIDFLSQSIRLLNLDETERNILVSLLLITYVLLYFHSLMMFPEVELSLFLAYDLGC